MLNKAMLIGRLGKDPEVRYTQDGAMITSFSIATDEKWKDKNGEKMQKTEWHNVVAFGKLAEICGNYLKKGANVFIEGKITTKQWEKDGVKHNATQIVINDMKMLDGKKASGQAIEPGQDVPF